MHYDAVLVLSFGGPESREDVIPFLENVLRGRNVPRERMLEVAEHYYHLGGRSPINDQNRALIAALEGELRAHGPQLPVYWGNRNWHPLLADTLRRMAADGVKRAVAFVTSSFSSYSGCRQYLEDIDRARAEVGEPAPQLDKLRAFFNHPGFIETMTDRLRQALAQISEDRRSTSPILFTAHSIPVSMAESCPYVQQLEESCRLVTEAAGCTDWRIVYQSRSGPPTQAWLEPDIGEALREIAQAGHPDVVVMPIGFVSDHMEVLYDLDTEAYALSKQLGLNLVRAATAGTHPAFIRMIGDLIRERESGASPKVIGAHALAPDLCAPGCCPAGSKPDRKPV
jgi:protoporphyrin/coproporphyrin ferrochelatase